MCVQTLTEFTSHTLCGSSVVRALILRLCLLLLEGNCYCRPVVHQLGGSVI